MDTTEEGNNFLQYLTFRVAGEEYAVEILQVKELITYRATTKVPMTLDYLSGVINLRGSVVPVVDLAVKFGFPPLVVSNRTCIVIVDVQLDTERTVIGIVVEAVNAVIDLDPADIEAPPSFGAGVCTDYLRGLGKIGDRLVPILDVDLLLSSDTALASIASESVEGAEPARNDEGPSVQPSSAADANAGPEPA
jgi:purine-binding chemotaxis protein CheW